MSDCEKFILSRGLNSFVPPRLSTSSAAVFAEIELLYLQLRRHSLAPSGNIAYLKAGLADLTQSFVNTSVDSHSFLWQKVHFESAKQPKMNSDIVLTKPDKGAGVVISNRADYIPLDKTVSMCADFLYRGPSASALPFSEQVFIELMGIATKSVSFRLNEILYRQIEDVSMGSPLGPILANIFVGFQERRLFKKFSKPFIYLRYVDDTFVSFKSRNNALLFFDKLNELHFFFNIYHGRRK